MERKLNAVTSAEIGQTEVTKEKVVKISEQHHRMLLTELVEVNKDERFKKKIGLKRYVEVLIDDHRKDCIEKLKSEREGSEDWLRVEHKRRAPELPFFDWLKEMMNEKKSKRS